MAKVANDLIVSVRGTDVKSVKFNNALTLKAGERLDIQVTTNVAVKLNPSAPTNAVVLVKFDAKDKNGAVDFCLETITAVQSSTYVEDFEKYIRENYLNTIMLAVNEKVRSVSAIVGFNLGTPAIAFGLTQKDENVADNVISFDIDRKK